MRGAQFRRKIKHAVSELDSSKFHTGVRQIPVTLLKCDIGSSNNNERKEHDVARINAQTWVPVASITQPLSTGEMIEPKPWNKVQRPIILPE